MNLSTLWTKCRLWVLRRIVIYSLIKYYMTFKFWLLHVTVLWLWKELLWINSLCISLKLSCFCLHCAPCLAIHSVHSAGSDNLWAERITTVGIKNKISSWVILTTCVPSFCSLSILAYIWPILWLSSWGIVNFLI